MYVGVCVCCVYFQHAGIFVYACPGHITLLWGVMSL